MSLFAVDKFEKLGNADVTVLAAYGMCRQLHIKANCDIAQKNGYHYHN